MFPVLHKLQRGAAATAGLGPFLHWHVSWSFEEFCVKGNGVLHETILGADTQSVIVALDVGSSKTDHHVFVQMSLGAEITTEEVKGQREEVLSFLTGAARVGPQALPQRPWASLESRKTTLSAACFCALSPCTGPISAILFLCHFSRRTSLLQWF